MIERLCKQQSSVNWIELNKREKMQQRLLKSLSRDDKLPMAFYDPNHKTQLLRNHTNRSTMSARSHRSSISAKNTQKSPIALKKFKFDYYEKHRKTPNSARKRSYSARDDDGNRSARLAADRNFGKSKFVSKLPDKALRQTFQIQKEKIQTRDQHQRNHDAVIKSL